MLNAELKELRSYYGLIFLSVHLYILLIVYMQYKVYCKQPYHPAAQDPGAYWS